MSSVSSKPDQMSSAAASPAARRSENGSAPPSAQHRHSGRCRARPLATISCVAMPCARLVQRARALPQAFVTTRPASGRLHNQSEARAPRARLLVHQDFAELAQSATTLRGARTAALSGTSCRAPHSVTCGCAAVLVQRTRGQQRAAFEGWLQVGLAALQRRFTVASQSAPCGASVAHCASRTWCRSAATGEGAWWHEQRLRS